MNSKVKVELDAKVMSEPKIIGSQTFSQVYEVEVSVPRKSNSEDLILVHYSKEIGVDLKPDMYISIVGDLRTMNNRLGYPIVAYVYANTLTVFDEQPEKYRNHCWLDVVEVSSIMPLRKSYSDDTVDVQDFSVNIIKSHGRKYNFRISLWYEVARGFNNTVKVGDFVNIHGRLQSYISKTNHHYITVSGSRYTKLRETEDKVSESETTPDD